MESFRFLLPRNGSINYKSIYESYDILDCYQGSTIPPFLKPGNKIKIPTISSNEFEEYESKYFDILIALSMAKKEGVKYYSL